MVNTRIAGRSGQQGFTLIELIVVIVVLGILVATAVPKYLSVTKDARIAALNGLVAGINGSVNITDAKAKLSGLSGNTGTVTDGVNTINVSLGQTPGKYFPVGTTAGIGLAVDSGGFSISYVAGPPGVATFVLQQGGTSISNCQVTYTGPTAGTTDAVVATVTSGC